MRVLHLWSVSGVGEIIAREMDRSFGTTSTVLVRKKFDRFGYNTSPVADGRYRFALRSLLQARKNDVVQVHSWDEIVPWLKRFTSPPVVLTYHNFNIRKEWAARKKKHSRADATVIATPGLADGLEAVFIPDPVDTDLFFDTHHHVKGTALHTEYWATEDAQRIADERGLKLTVLRRQSSPVPHSEMPKLLNQYEYYIDVKRLPTKSPEIIQATSKTCLEALACGCKVIRWDEKVLEGLQDENRPGYVARKYFELYSSLLKS